MNGEDKIRFRRFADIIHEIQGNSVDSHYIYRGEDQVYSKSSSGLYRSYSKKQVENPDVMGSQESILEKIGTFLPEMNEVPSFEILAQLQHYGAKTNLIDFTTDYFIALFFACEKKPTKDGRVLLLKTVSDDYEVVQVPRTIHRIESQKGVFVQSPKGYIEPNHVVNIPYDLKSFILKRLMETYAITEKYIYTDIHDFIKSEDIELHYLEFHKASRMQKEWERLYRRAETGIITQEEHNDLQSAFDKAAHHYQTAIKLQKEFLEAYLQLAQIYFLKDEFDRSIEIYNQAMEWILNSAILYAARGTAYRFNNELNLSIEDYSRAIELEPDNAYFYYEQCISLMEKREWTEFTSGMVVITELTGATTLSEHLAKLANEERMRSRGM